jgi:hypothetical protein
MKQRIMFFLPELTKFQKTSSFSTSLGQRSIVELFAHGSKEHLSQSKRARNNVFKAGNFSHGSVLNGNVCHDVVQICELRLYVHLVSAINLVHLPNPITVIAKAVLLEIGINVRVHRKGTSINRTI